jgi:hypothetical protein
LLIQIISILGALMILIAFAGVQIQRLRPDSLVYLVLNTVGAGVLATVALVEQQWGFVLLEGIWTLVSLWALARRQLAPMPPDK